MARGTLEVTEGTSDIFLDTSVRTISGVARHAQYMLEGESENPTYSAIAYNISIATSGDHVIAIQGDGTNYSRLRGIRIGQNTLAGAASNARFRLKRLSTAGTGGGAITSYPFDAADAAYAGGIATLNTVKGTEGATLLNLRLSMPAAQPLAEQLVWNAFEGIKPIVFGTSADNGLALVIDTGIASATVDVQLIFTVTSFL